MKNLVSLVVYDSDNDSYQIISAKTDDGLVCLTFPFRKRSPRDLSDEIDQIKRRKTSPITTIHLKIVFRKSC